MNQSVGPDLDGCSPARVITISMLSSFSREAAVNRQSNSHHEASAWTAEPSDGGRNVIGMPKAAIGLLFHDLGHRVPLTFQHFGDHRRDNRARTNGVDADASGSLFDSSEFRHAQNRVLVSVNGSSFPQTNEPSYSAAVDARTTVLCAHNAQRMFHVGPEFMKAQTPR